MIDTILNVLVMAKIAETKFLKNLGQTYAIRGMIENIFPLY